MILVDADGVTMTRPGRPLFADASVTVSSGDRFGIVGLNGTGKSTLLSVLAGSIEPESGVVRRGRGVRVAVLDQDPTLVPGTVREALVHDLDAGDEGGGAATWEAESVLDRLGMGSALDVDVSTLSGGQRKRVALARALVMPADLLVLDEPTNHLDIDAIAWLEERLDRLAGGLLLVTHDRHLLDRVTTRTLEVDRGTVYVHEGGYSGYLEAKARREEHAATTSARRRNLARREKAWLERGAPARTSKSKARVVSAEALQVPRDDGPTRPDDLDLHFGTPRLGDQVVDLHGVGHRFDDGPMLFAGVDLLLAPDERLGIVGVNGSGKSTLLDIIAARVEPAEGRRVTGPTVRLGYYDQLGRTLDPAKRVIDVVAGDNAEPEWWDKRLLEQFWFDSDTQFAPIELLSGGERRRLQLLLELLAKPNVLLLDEPTNDLDVDTLRVLEDFLEDWPGALVVVSHDRAFLERTVDDVIVLDGAGRAGRLPGGYEAWEAERRKAQKATLAGSTRTRSAVASTGGVPGATDPGGPPSRSTLRFRLKDIEKRLAKLEKRRGALTEKLAASGADHEALRSLGDELAEIESGVEATEEEWLAVSELLESA